MVIGSLPDDPFAINAYVDICPPRLQDPVRADPRLACMMYALYIARRTQIYLDDEQDRQLADRARQVGRTKSALIRDAIDAYLTPASSEDAALAGLRAAVEDAAGAAPYLPSGVEYVEEPRAAERKRQNLIDQRR